VRGIELHPPRRILERHEARRRSARSEAGSELAPEQRRGLECADRAPGADSRGRLPAPPTDDRSACSRHGQTAMGLERGLVRAGSRLCWHCCRWTAVGRQCGWRCHLPAARCAGRWPCGVLGESQGCAAQDHWNVPSRRFDGVCVLDCLGGCRGVRTPADAGHAEPLRDRHRRADRGGGTVARRSCDLCDHRRRTNAERGHQHAVVTVEALARGAPTAPLHRGAGLLDVDSSRSPVPRSPGCWGW